MKRAASCKHRQAVKNIRCEKKLFKSHLHSSMLGKRVEKHATSTNQRMAALMQHGKPSSLLVVLHTVPLTVGNHQLTFLIDLRFCCENLRLKLKKRNKNNKNTNFMIKNKKKKYQ